MLSTGEATWDEALLLFLERSGYSEETYHTFSYSPLRDDDGAWSACSAWSARTPTGSSASGGWRRCATSAPTPAWSAPSRRCWPSPHASSASNLRDLPFTLTYLFDDDGDARLAGVERHRRRASGGARDAAGRRTATVWPVAAGRATANRCWSTSTARRCRTCRPGTGRSRRRRRWWCRCCSRAARRRVPGRRAEPVPPARRAATAASSSWSPGTSPPGSPARAATRPSSGAPRSWPSWTGPRPRSSPTSATSSAPR